MTDSFHPLQIIYDDRKKCYLMKVPPEICSSLSLSGSKDGLLLRHSDRNEIEKLKDALMSAVEADGNSLKRSSNVRLLRMVIGWAGIVLCSLLVAFEGKVTSRYGLSVWPVRMILSLLIIYCLYTIFVTYHSSGSGRAFDELSLNLEKIRLQQDISQRFS